MNKLKEERTNTQILRRDSNRRDVGRSSQLAVKHIINSSKREKKASFSLSYGLNAEHYAYWNYTREITKLPANHTQAVKSKIHVWRYYYFYYYYYKHGTLFIAACFL